MPTREESLWLLEKLVPGSGVNNLSVVFTVNGRLDRTAVEDAVTTLLRRHEALRTGYLAGAATLEKRVTTADEAKLALVSLPPDERPVPEALADFVAEPFTLDGGILVRAGVLSRRDGDVFCLVAHHLVFDTVSGEILLDEFAKAYQGFVRDGEPPAELTVECPATPVAEPSEESLAFWRAHLRGFIPPESGLWCGNPGADSTLAGGHRTHLLSPEATEAVRTLRTHLRAPESAVLLAAYSLLLTAHGAGEDQVIGAPTNLRPTGHDRAIGYHVNVVPMRTTVDLRQGFGAVVRHCRDVFLEAVAHADVPAELLASELPRIGGSWRNTLVRHLFNYLPGMDLPEFGLAGLTAEPMLVENGFSKYDLEFFVMTSEERIELRAVHCRDVLADDDVERLLERYDALLCALAREPERAVGEIPVWSQRDHEVIDAANDTARPVDPATVVEAIAARVAEAPSAVAVEDGDRTTTYRQLWNAAAATREELTGSGVTAGDVVALACPRGAALAAAALGVLLTGAAYLPIDPDHPAARIRYQLEDSGARAVLANTEIPAPDGRTVLPVPNPESTVDKVSTEVPRLKPSSRAYLVYTSGTTGKPKSSLLTHRGLANVIAHFAAELRAGPGTGTLWLTTFTFDISSLELFLPLVTGGRIVVAPERARSSGPALLDLLARHDVDIVQATPTTWRIVAEDLRGELSGRRVLCGGEPLSPALARSLVEAGAEVRNAYAPSETTIYSTCREIGEDGHVDIGGPIANTKIFVADPDGRPLPVGVRGELCIAGDGVAQGYHNRPRLTAERFGRRPGYGRFYRTSDLGRWRADGTIELLGRVDRQVKLRGNRIELAEVEAVLAAHPDVRAAAVVLAGDPTADGTLVAFVESERDTDLADRLWAHASAELPSAAVPGEFVAVAALPVNANGKVDHLALERMAEENRAARAVGTANTEHADPTVARLLGFWRDALGRADVTPETNFFNHGGHSLLGAQLLQRIEEELGVVLPLAELFTRPTPIALAEALNGESFR